MSHQQPTILIVEDHRETRAFLKLALADDYIVETATSATETFDKIDDETHVDLMLIDIALRDSIDGIELVKKLRQRPALSNIPMIAMTAHQLRESEDYYLDRGFQAYLGKPFFPQDLLATISQLLDDAHSDGAESRPQT